MEHEQLEKLSYMHQPITVSSNTCSQTYVQIKYFLVYLQDLIPILAGVIAYISSTSQCTRECFICTYIWLHMFELTFTGWCI